MGAAERRKGMVGRRRAIYVLHGRGWQCEPTMEGIKCDDIVVIDPAGKKYSAEVKNTKTITLDHRKQAQRQAARRGLPWMLMSRIFGTTSWLVQRADSPPAVWREKVGKNGCY